MSSTFVVVISVEKDNISQGWVRDFLKSAIHTEMVLTRPEQQEVMEIESCEEE